MSTLTLSALPIRRLTPHDLQACADLSEARGWHRNEHRWSLLLTAGTGYGIDDPQGGLLAACVLTRYGSMDKPDFGSVGMLLVAERHERQGVGRRLMRHIIDAADATPLMLYATPYGRPLYEELGFKTIRQAEKLQGHFTPEEAASAPTADPVVTVRRAIAEDLPTLLRLDNEIFGIDRTSMITRLPAFADQLRVAESGGEITGYAATWPQADADVVGPLLAQDTPTAKALVTALARGIDRPLSITVDARQSDLLGWLTSHGLTYVGPEAVMVYGVPELPGDWTRNFAPLTMATG